MVHRFQLFIIAVANWLLRNATGLDLDDDHSPNRLPHWCDEWSFATLYIAAFALPGRDLVWALLDSFGQRSVAAENQGGVDGGVRCDRSQG